MMSRQKALPLKIKASRPVNVQKISFRICFISKILLWYGFAFKKFLLSIPGVHIFETFPLSSFLAQSWNKEGEKERVEMGHRGLGRRGAGVLVLGEKL
jgi:hypothetical protein